MSSNFSGVTFAEQRVTPADDALFHRAVLPDGILSGCELSYSGSTLTMAAGALLACGRQFRHAASQNWAVVGATSGYARLLLTIDLARTATEEAFDQVIDTLEYASSVDGFPALEQADLNAAGTRYQIAVCVVSLGTGGITGIVNQLGTSTIVASMAGKQLHVASPMSVVGLSYPTYAVKKTPDGEELGGLTYTVGDRRFYFVQYPADMDNADVRYKEAFALPVPTSGLTGTKWYGILTTKTPVTVAQGGTGANTAEQALLNLGGVKLVKLWENAADTNTFAAQTVTLNLSGYAGVFIYFKGVNSGAGYYFSGFIPMGKYGLLQLATTGGAIRQRLVNVKATGITFDAGQTDGEADNRFVIPVCIYGLKGAIA